MRALVLSVVVVLTISCGSGSVEPGPGGIVLVSIDTLRADHLGAYGYERNTSPFLDSLAARGVLFEQAVSAAPWTLPAHATMLTGVLPSTHRAVDADAAIATSVPTLAERLAEEGYATGGFVASWFVSSRYGFERGFESFEDFGATEAENNDKPVRATHVVDAAEAWLRENADRPFFLFVHVYDPHFNYDPPSRFAEEFDTGYRGPRESYRNYMYYLSNPVPEDRMAQEIALYDAEIRYVDEELGRLFAVLDDLGVGDRTLAVVTADHGEEFFERGSWGHAHTLFDELVRVPLIVSGPEVEGGRRLSAQVRHTDFVSTILDMAGLVVPAGLHGATFGGLLRGTADFAEESAPRPAFVETSRYSTNLAGVRTGGLKLIVDLERGSRTLYDLRDDPGETVDVGPSRTEQLRALHDQLMTVASSSIPDRWHLGWNAAAEGGVNGRISTTGKLISAKLREGEGTADVLSDRSAVDYRLEPGATLQIAVFPVDSDVFVYPPRDDDGRSVDLFLGAAGKRAPIGPLEARSVDAERFLGAPEEDDTGATGASFWLEQQRGGAVSLDLSDEEIRRLKSLGYVM